MLAEGLGIDEITFAWDAQLRSQENEMRSRLILHGKLDLKSLIQLGGIMQPDNKIIAVMQSCLTNKTTLALTSQDPLFALSVYREAEDIPSTTTQMNLESQGIQMNGQLLMGTTDLLICFKGTVPQVLKRISSKEWQRLADLRDLLLHNNVVTFENIKAAEGHFIIMPLYPSTLDHLHRLNVAGSELLWSQMQPALEGLHSKGVAHMDVKSANIFITEKGDFVLGDVGSLVKFGDRTSSTKAYIPADLGEVCKGCAAVDWWMLAMTFAEKSACVEVFRKTIKCEALKDLLRDCPALSAFGFALIDKLEPLPF